MDAVVGAARGDEQLLEIAQRRLGGCIRVRFGDHDANGADILVYDFAAFDLVLRPAEGIRAGGRTMHPVRRLLRHLHFREDVARRRIPTREVDARGLAYEAASTVAPDEILRAQ